MVSQTNIILVAPDDPCPCRSGKTTYECCMQADGTLRVKFASPLPPGGITSFSHARCYLRDTRNCSEDMSPDPYTSKSVADMFRAKAIDASLIWSNGRTTTVGIENPTSPIACSRHNSALSSLDAAAAQAFSNIFDAASYVIKKSLATKRTCYAASGEGLELWALKLLFGAHAAMAASGADAPKDSQPLHVGIFQRALEGEALARPCGLYLKRTVLQMGDPVGCGPLKAETTNRVTGLRFSAAALQFELIVDAAGLDGEAMRRQCFYRPSSIDFIGKKRTANIFLSGPIFGSNEAARFGLLEARAE
jgi:hypothetical protein